MRALLGLVLPVTAWLVGCGGKDVAVGGLPTTGSATGPEVFTPAQVQSARAQCNGPDGPVQTIATYGAMQAAITGSWLLCSTQGDGSGDDPSAGWATSSREFDANGQWISLGLDSQGGLVRVYGVDNQGDWEVEYGDALDASADTPLLGGGSLTMHFDSGGGNGGSVAFESSPSRMQWQPDYFTALYVPLGP